MMRSSYVYALVMRMMYKKRVLYLFLVVSKQHNIDAARTISSVKPC